MKKFINPKLINIVLKKLEDDFVYSRIIHNPRSFEIIQHVVGLAEDYGTPINDSLGAYYIMQMTHRVDALLNILSVDERGSVVVTLPLKYPEEEQDIILYEPDIEDGLKRTTYKKKCEQVEETIVSYMNSDGIETKQEINKRRGNVIIERMEQYPHIIKTTVQGKEEYLDISKLNEPQDIVIEGALRINKEDIKELEQVDKLRIVQKAKYGTYEKGVNKLYGIEQEKQEDIQIK